jgi:hypothetical protein
VTNKTQDEPVKTSKRIAHYDLILAAANGEQMQSDTLFRAEGAWFNVTAQSAIAYLLEAPKNAAHVRIKPPEPKTRTVHIRPFLYEHHGDKDLGIWSSNSDTMQNEALRPSFRGWLSDTITIEVPV